MTQFDSKLSNRKARSHILPISPFLISIIAVSYEARAHGVTRNMWADDAKKLCPDLQVARVRESHGKADLTW